MDKEIKNLENKVEKIKKQEKKETNPFIYAKKNNVTLAQAKKALNIDQ